MAGRETCSLQCHAESLYSEHLNARMRDLPRTREAELESSIYVVSFCCIFGPAEMTSKWIEFLTLSLEASSFPHTTGWHPALFCYFPLKYQATTVKYGELCDVLT